METLLLSLVGGLGVLFVWGLFSPRSQWRVLISWSYRDPHANEPTGFAYGLYRLIAAVGIATMAVSGVVVYHSTVDNVPPPPAPPTAVQKMWGVVNPVVVNRVVTPISTVPTGLVDQPILGYQVVVGQTRQPPYLFGLHTFSQKGATDANGLVGTDPAAGLVALDSAQLVVKLAGDRHCFPHKVVVIEGSNTVKIGVFYGQQDPADGSNKDKVAQCATTDLAKSVVTLLPIPLVNSLKDRELQNLDGEPITEVRLITK